MSEEGEKQSLQYMTLTYIGKDFVKKFENEDGSVTKSYKYKFKQNMDQQYAIGFWGYDTTKGAEMLAEGEIFDIGYIEKDNPKGDKPMKMARFFGTPTEGRKLASEKGAVKTPVPKLQFDVGRFADKYRETDKIPISEKTVFDFVGRFIKNTEQNKFRVLEKLYNEVVMPNTDDSDKEPDFD